MADRRFFVEVFEEIVEQVQQKWDLLDNQDPPQPIPEEDREKPYYEFGHPAEIANILAQKDESPSNVYKKYPMIALLTDFTEEPGGDLYLYNVPCTVLICATTDPNYSGRQQMDINYVPTLQPLYDLLLEAITDNFDIQDVYINDIRPQKINRLHWGAEGVYQSEGLIFDDTIDVIQLNFSRMRVKHPECETA